MCCCNFTDRSQPVLNISKEPTTIEAQDRSSISMNIGDNVTALTNTNITIECYASGVPTPTFTWTKDERKILFDVKYSVQEDNSLLIIASEKTDTGSYRCTAESVTGKDSTTSMVQIVGG